MIAPDGIIIHLSGPYAGTRHDAFILHESKLLEVAAESLRADDILFSMAILLTVDKSTLLHPLKVHSYRQTNKSLTRA